MLEWYSDLNELKAIREQLELFPRVYTRILARALNRSSKGVVTDSLKHLSRRYRRKQKDFKDSFSVFKANPKELYARVKSIGERASHLSDWNAKQTKKGVTFRVLKEGKKRLLKGAFIAKGKDSRKEIVFMRSSKDRYPIKAMYSTTGLDMLRDKDLQKTLQAGAKQRLISNIQHDAQYELQKIADKAKG